MLTPAIFIILLVLGFNFLGDGLRDAADPYATHN
jgi:peptide/nickel transport system permease protein